MSKQNAEHEQLKLRLILAPTDRPWRGLWEWLLAPADQLNSLDDVNQGFAHGTDTIELEDANGDIESST